jgi:hypothetical protein
LQRMPEQNKEISLVITMASLTGLRERLDGETA